VSEETKPQVKLPHQDHRDTGIWFVSACSGLLYRERKAAGGVSAILIDGERFEIVEPPDPDAAPSAPDERRVGEAKIAEIRHRVATAGEEWHRFISYAADDVRFLLAALDAGRGQMN